MRSQIYWGRQVSNDNNLDGVYWKRRCEIAEAMLSGVRKAMNEAREQNRMLTVALEQIAECSYALRSGGPTPGDEVGLDQGLQMAVNLAVEALEKMPVRGFRTDNA